MTALQAIAAKPLSAQHKASRARAPAPRFVVHHSEGPLLASAQRHIVSSAMDFLMASLVDYRSEPVDALEAALKAAFIPAFEGGAFGMDNKQFKRMEAGRTAHDFDILAWRAFANSAFDAAKSMGLQPFIPNLTRSLSGDESDAIMAEFGLQPVESLKSVDLTDGHALAHVFTVARYRLDLANARLVVLGVLGLLIRPLLDNMVDNATVTAQYHRLHERLAARRQQAKLEVMALGVLEGQTGILVARAMAREMYGPGKQVMHLISHDGVLPSSWRSEQEQALRVAIDRA